MKTTCLITIFSYYDIIIEFYFGNSIIQTTKIDTINRRFVSVLSKNDKIIFSNNLIKNGILNRNSLKYILKFVKPKNTNK